VVIDNTYLYDSSRLLQLFSLGFTGDAHIAASAHLALHINFLALLEKIHHEVIVSLVQLDLGDLYLTQEALRLFCGLENLEPHIASREIQKCVIILTEIINDITLDVFNRYHHFII
jgi:hypothetical protein